MTDKEAVRALFPDAEVVTLEEIPAFAISVAHRKHILANGVTEEDAWKQAAVIIHWTGRLRKTAGSAEIS